MEKLNTSIQNFLENYGLKKGVKQNSAVLYWEEVVGKKISENTEVQGVEHGTLTVSVSNPAWRQELLFKKKEIRCGYNLYTNRLVRKFIKER